MTSYAYAIPILEGQTGPLLARLDDLPDDALAALGAPVNVFVGEGELVLHFPDAPRDAFAQDAWREERREALRDLLDEHTAFSPESPDRWLIRELRESGEPVETEKPSATVS